MQESSKQIAQFIREGRKIEAIKLLRETTGLGLKEAKEEIERLEAGLSGDVAYTPLPNRVEIKRLGTVSKEVVALAREGKKIEAIKLHREQTGLGLKEAKQQVELATGSEGSGGGCMSVVVLMLVVGIVGLCL